MQELAAVEQVSVLRKSMQYGAGIAAPLNRNGPLWDILQILINLL
jgi:hypothetical protein